MRRQSRAQPLPFGPSQTSAAHKPEYHLQPGFTHLPSPVSPAVAVPFPFGPSSPVSPRILPSIDSQLLSPVSPMSSIVDDHRSQRASTSSTSSGSNSDESMVSSVVSLSSESSSDFPATPPTSLPGSPSSTSSTFSGKLRPLPRTPSPSPSHHRSSTASGPIRPLPRPMSSPAPTRPRAPTMPSSRPPQLSVIISSAPSTPHMYAKASTSRRSLDDSATPRAVEPASSVTLRPPSATASGASTPFSISDFPMPPPLVSPPPPVVPPKSPRHASRPARVATSPRATVALSFARARQRRTRAIPPQRAPPRMKPPSAPQSSDSEAEGPRALPPHFATPPRKLVVLPATPPPNRSSFALGDGTPARVRPLPLLPPPRSPPGEGTTPIMRSRMPVWIAGTSGRASESDDAWTSDGGELDWGAIDNAIDHALEVAAC
ncbi:unnamed protein product [Peniophora sp. CBMAI 1063]|nr:unnamed protein product [Peniophora sp. CBMAI 1063]